MEKIRSLQLSLYLSIRYNDLDVFMILLPSVNLNIPLANGQLLLQEAIRYKRTTMIFHILNKSDPINKEIEIELNTFFSNQASKSSTSNNIPPRSVSSP